MVRLPCSNFFSPLIRDSRHQRIISSTWLSKSTNLKYRGLKPSYLSLGKDRLQQRTAINRPEC